jgi:hypothetical protein
VDGSFSLHASFFLLGMALLHVAPRRVDAERRPQATGSPEASTAGHASTWRSRLRSRRSYTGSAVRCVRLRPPGPVAGAPRVPQRPGRRAVAPSEARSCHTRAPFASRGDASAHAVRPARHPRAEAECQDSSASAERLLRGPDACDAAPHRCAAVAKAAVYAPCRAVGPPSVRPTGVRPRCEL